jgi:antitoxin PrlF
MAYEVEATVTSKGQVTIPVGIRERLGVKAGDALRFRLSETGELTVVPRRKRSIFEIAREMPLPALDRPLTQQDIDNAIGDAMAEQEDRIKRQWKR